MAHRPAGVPSDGTHGKSLPCSAQRRGASSLAAGTAGGSGATAGVPMALSAGDDDQMDKLVTTVHAPDGHVVTYEVDGVIRLWRTDEPGVPLQVGTQDEDVSVLALSDGCVVTAVSLRLVSRGFGRVASSGVWPSETAQGHPCLRSSSDRWAGKCGGKCGVSASDRLRVSDVHGCDDSVRVSDLLRA